MIHTYAWTHTHAHTHAQTHTQTHTRTCICTCACTAHAHIHIHTCMHACMHAHEYIWIFTNVFIYSTNTHYFQISIGVRSNTVHKKRHAVIILMQIFLA